MFKILTYKYFDPSQISGLKAWYDADTLTGSDGSAISEWLDSSGNGANMFQSTTTAQPTLQTSELNSRNVVRFDGVDDFLTQTAPLNTLPTSVNTYHSTQFSKTGNYLAHCNATTAPRITLYKRTNDIFRKLPDLTGTVGTIGGMAWSSDDTYFSASASVSPRILIYKRSGDTFTQLSNPATLPSANAVDCDYSPNDTYLAVCGQMTGLMLVYKRSGDTFTALSNPAVVPAGTLANTVKFSPTSDFLAISSNAAPYIQFYSRSGDVFTKLTNPATVPSYVIYGISWLNESTVAIAGNNATVSIYKFNGANFELLTSFSLASGTSFGCRYSNDGSYLAVACSTTPFVRIYQVTNNGLTYTELAQPETIPPNSGRGVSFSPDGSYLSVAHSTAPNLQIYKKQSGLYVNLSRYNLLRNVSGTTVFMVVKYPKNNLTNYSYTVTNNANTGRFALFTETTNNPYVLSQNIDGGTTLFTSYSIQPNTFAIQTGIGDFSNGKVVQYWNGSLVGTSTGGTASNSSNTNSTNIQIGKWPAGTSNLNGDIAELIVYNRVLTDSELNDLHNYLSVKWGVTLA